MTWIFSVTPRIVFGPGTAEQAGSEISLLDSGSVLVITDGGVLGAGLVKPVVDSLKAAGKGVTVFSDVRPKPLLSDADSAVEVAREKGGIDSVVGVGGGSSMDVAKVVAACIGCDVKAAEFLQPGALTVSSRLPLVLMPTTAGTGSEVTPVSILIDSDGRERAARDHRLTADTAIVDPEMTLTLPAGLTAASGIDALAHAVESYTGKGATPLTDVLALRAIDAIARWLPRAVVQNRNIEARTEVMLASMLAGISFANANNTLAHACAGAICSTHAVPHALGVAATLPAVEEFNYTVVPEKLNRVVGLLGAADVKDGATVSSVFRGFIESVGAPHGLFEAGISADEIEQLAGSAIKSKLTVNNNPREASQDDIKAILRQPMEWK